MTHAGEQSPLLSTMLLASASGARSMTGVAALSASLAGARSNGAVLDQQPARAFADARVATTLKAAAGLEILGDKLPSAPDRIAPVPLLGRAMAGATVGAAIAAASGRNRGTSAVVGALTAVVAAHLSFHGRRRLSELVDPTFAAVIEDAAVLTLTALGVASLGVASLDSASRDPESTGVAEAAAVP